MPRIRTNGPEGERRINEGIAADPDTYVPTDEEWVWARRVRGPQRAPTKVAVSIRLDRDVVESLKAEGAGWQGRANRLLRRALGLG